LSSLCSLPKAPVTLRYVTLRSLPSSTCSQTLSACVLPLGWDTKLSRRTQVLCEVSYLYSVIEHFDHVTCLCSFPFDESLELRMWNFNTETDHRCTYRFCEPVSLNTHSYKRAGTFRLRAFRDNLMSRYIYRRG
jgi:hypothetical protein